MTTQEIKTLIKKELPTIIQEDEEIYQFILHISRKQFADKQETESRFDRILEELRQDRLENHQRWEEQNRKWEEQNRKWDENDHKWAENQKTLNAMLEEIRMLSRKHDSTIGALGASWGLNTEESFRSALRSILEESFGVEVLNITEFDDRGEVFGQPDQVELDVIIQNGILIICEIKSSMSRSDVYTFSRKVNFYERLHNRTANRKIIISPMVRDDARRTAEKLRLEVFSYAEDVKP